MLRLALCNEVIRDLDIASQFAVAAELGYDGLELAPFTVSDTPDSLPSSIIATIRRAAANAGIAVSGLHWLLVKPDGLSLTSEDAATRARTVEFMRRLVGLCAELGGAYLVHGSPVQRRLPEHDPATARGWVEGAFMAAGEAAGAAGVTYCIEPLAPDLTNCINTVAEAAVIVQHAGLPALRTMLDTSAARGGERDAPETVLAEWLPSGLLAHVHLNDANRRGPGQGADRFAPVLRTLHEAGWAGWIGVEPFDYVPDGPMCAARAIGYLRGIEETLA